ncbi:Ornithine_carbamoyltransferase [Hexamita inflata]|uniref:ornithine carbamoyltransferase n=1 Tax=Hexamita inflata TaxID=28002 RepID=A0AA86QKQ5_9EUKA|nr:Ornithine carbamoyltransferase [Hexamita inflata]
MPFAQTRHLMTITSLTKEEFIKLVDLAIAMKTNPQDFVTRCQHKTLLALFAKPSLRTRVSLETAMTKLGGHTIYYELGDKAPLGVKETIEDTAEVISRMVDVCSARLPTRAMMEELAKFSSIPCLNALDDWAHPLQMVCDFVTIKEKFGKFDGLKMTYSGDCMNNVTYDLMRACALLGMEMRVCCPDHPDFKPVQEVMDECAKLNAIHGGKTIVLHDVKVACKGVDIVYCDSWMSYHITKEDKAKRLAVLMPYQINAENFGLTTERSIFMNCLPAARGEEQTAEVIDGPKSVIYQEAGNRLWSAMAVLDFFINQKK